MIRLLLFLKKTYVLLLFVVMEVVCLTIFFGQSPYQRAKMMSVSNYFVGGLHSYLSGVSNYFSLSQQNISLLRENAFLRTQLADFVVDTTRKIDSLGVQFEQYKVVRVVNNSFTKRNNFITISSGTAQGIEPDMALFNSDGIVGYVKYCSENFSVAISLLNHLDFHTSGKVRGSDNAGSIGWDGVDYEVVTMDDIPAHSNIQLGDTVVTTSYSNIFPSDLPIGIVLSVKNANSMRAVARLRTLSDMSRLTYLYAVSLKNQRERQRIESLVQNSD